MSILNLIHKLDISDDLRSTVLNVASYLTYNLNEKDNVNIVHKLYSDGLTRYRSWSVIIQPHRSSSIAQVFEAFPFQDYEYDELNSSDYTIDSQCADHYFLENDQMIPEISADNDSVPTDALATALAAICLKDGPQQNYYNAYKNLYLQFVSSAIETKMGDITQIGFSSELLVDKM